MRTTKRNGRGAGGSRGEPGGLEELRHQQDAADSKITQAKAGVSAAESQIDAAEAGVAAARSSIRTAEAGLSGVRAQFEDASQEIERQQGLYASKATPLQKLQSQRAQTASARALVESYTLRQKPVLPARDGRSRSIQSVLYGSIGQTLSEH